MEICTMEYHSGHEKEGNPATMLIREISQTEKAGHCMTSLICRI